MKKVYVATYFDWFSYGAVLQSLAFNHFLREMAYDAKLIHYQHQDMQGTNHKSVKSIIKNMLLFAEQNKTKRKTTAFINENIAHTQEFHAYGELQSLDEAGACFISGSDQVWNPSLCSPFFFLDFVQKGKAISYAASMGNTNVPEENAERFWKYISKFKRISVREETVKELLADKGFKDAEVHLDPTLLYPAEFWEQFETEIRLPSQYILLFPIYWDERFNQELKKLHEETGLPIVALSTSMKVYCNIRMGKVTPSDFLWLVHHADRVITSSFHGAVFSIIFRKKYSVLIDPNKPSRLSDLLGMLSLQNAISEDCGHYLEWDQDMSDHVEQVLSGERHRTEKYLREAIGS